MTTIRRLVTELGFDADQAALNRYDRGMRSLMNTVKLTAAAFAAGFGVREIIQAADEMQSLRARMSQIPQAGDDAAATLDEVSKHAIAARTNIQAYGEFFTRVAFASKEFVDSQKEVLAITGTVAKALIVGGSDPNEARSVMGQLSQALGSNRLGGDEFRSLREAAPQLVTAMADALGKTRGELAAMSEQGDLTTRVVIGALNKMGDAFDARLKQMPLTWKQATTIMYSRWAMMLERFNQKSMIITRMAEGALRAFDLVEAGIYKIGDAVSWLVEQLGGWTRVLRVIKSILIALALWKGVAMVYALGKAILSVKAAMLILSKAIPFLAFAAFVALIEDFIAWTQGKKSVLGSIFGDWGEFKQQVETVLKPTIAALKDLIAAFQGNDAGKFWDAFAAAFNAAANVVMLGLDKIEEKIKNLAPSWLRDAITAAESALNKANSAVTTAGEATNRLLGGTGQTNLFTGRDRDPATDASTRSGGTRTVNQNVTSSVNLQVPAGTSQEQARFLEEQTDYIFQRNWQTQMDNAAGEFAGGK